MVLGLEVSSDDAAGEVLDIDDGLDGDGLSFGLLSDEGELGEGDEWSSGVVSELAASFLSGTLLDAGVFDEGDEWSSGVLSSALDELAETDTSTFAVLSESDSLAVASVGVVD